VTPAQMVVKILNDHLVEKLGGTVADLDLNATPPVVIPMVGLRGSGKTTSCAKIGYRLSQGPQGMAAEFGGSFSVKRRVMMASLDTRRPAAQQQLKILGEQTGVPTLPIVPLERPLAITKRALETARREGFDVLILDTAGRLSIDEELMKEVADISALASPKETLLLPHTMPSTSRHGPPAPAMRAVVLRPRCAPSPGARSSSSASARSSMRWSRSIPTASPAASSAWATSSPWSSAPPRRSRKRMPKSSRPRSARASSTWMTC